MKVSFVKLKCLKHGYSQMLYCTERKEVKSDFSSEAAAAVVLTLLDA